ncbi:MAG: branched-chain amino acid ABC transporter permease [Nitrososphaerales archaeon]
MPDPIFSAAVSFLSYFGIFSILSLSLNLEYGFGGQPNFGKVAFYATGAFVAGVVASRLMPLIAGIAPLDPFSPEGTMQRVAITQSNPYAALLTFLIALLLAALISGAFGYLVSYPAIRIREEWFLAMVLLVTGEILRVVVRSYPPIVNGYNGVLIPNPFRWLGDADQVSLAYMVLILVIALGVYIYINKLVNSPFGRLLKSMRDDQIAATSLGKDLVKVRGQVLILGSALAGLAGVLYAYYSGYVNPDDFIPIRTFDVWVMVVLGGIANNRGVLLGAAIMTAIDRGTQILAIQLQTFGGIAELNYLRYIIVGILMLAILMFRQKGILPEKPVKTPAYEVVKVE